METPGSLPLTYQPTQTRDVHLTLQAETLYCSGNATYCSEEAVPPTTQNTQGWTWYPLETLALNFACPNHCASTRARIHALYDGHSRVVGASMRRWPSISKPLEHKARHENRNAEKVTWGSSGNRMRLGFHFLGVKYAPKKLFPTSEVQYASRELETILVEKQNFVTSET